MSSGDPDTLALSLGLDSAYLDGLFQGGGFAIVACDVEGRIVTANAAARRLLGQDALDSGRAACDLFPESDRGRVAALLAQCAATLEAIEFQVRIGGGETDPLEYSVWITPVLERDGTIRGVALWFRDITTRVRLARQLEKRGRLESLGTLAGAVAHHYNNALCSIATSLDYATNMNTLPAMRNALRRTADALARATNITQQLLAFAQADRRSADLADLTETVLFYFDQHEARLKAHNINLLLEWQVTEICPVPRDKLLIVIGNVVDNAVDAMAGGGTLDVSLSRRDENSLCLSITDSGGGIRPSDKEHLFEPFYTSKGELAADCGTGRNPGLGLAVAHGLVAEMHGEISADNVPGRGARFDIVLPLNHRTDEN